MKKPFLIGLFILTAAIIASSVGFYFWWQQQLRPISNSSALRAFTVTPRSDARTIVNNLHNQQLIRSVFAGRLYLKSTGLESKLRPGAYELSPDLSLPQIFTRLTSGPKDIWVTIPEGWRREQIAARLNANLTSFLSSFDPQAFIAETATLEGRLFPDTYLLPTYANSDDIVQVFLNNFKRQTQIDPTATYQISLGVNQLTLTGNQVINFASLVEREAKAPTDRPLIAGILLNRFNEEEGLYVDATVQYAQDTAAYSANPSPDFKFWEPITDTKFASDFNTYLHAGLPPHPIANPGKASLEAVLQPQDTPNRYYLTDDQGQMHYARTLAEHNQNIDKYLKP